MDFLAFLGGYFTHLSWSDPKTLAVVVLVVALAFLRRWLQAFLVLGLVVAGQAIGFYFPQTTTGIVGDLSAVQIVYIVGGVLIAISGLGQMVLRH